MVIPRFAGFLGALAVLIPGVAQAQGGVTVDEGEFRISVGGEPVGTESFGIRRAGVGADERVLAQGSLLLTGASGARSVRSQITTRGGSSRLAEAVLTEDAEGRVTDFRIRLDGPRYVANLVSPEGQRQKEFRAQEGVLLLEDGFAHHYHFLARILDAGTTVVRAILPMQARSVDLSVTVTPGLELLIGGRPVAARRVTLGEGPEERSVWLDPQGRVLRVEVPALGLEAVRTRPPS